LIDTGLSVSTSWSEPAESISNILEQLGIGDACPRRLTNGYQSVLAHVGQKYPNNAERKVQVGGKISDRLGPTTIPDHGLVLGLEPEVTVCASAGR
jgi:hypothetical protein